MNNSNEGTSSTCNRDVDGGSVVDSVQCMNSISEISISQTTLVIHQQQKQQQQKILRWSSHNTPIPLSTENAILPILMQYGKKEHGMFKYQKQHRVQKVQKACRDHNIRLDQALSLRRHHINNLNPYTTMSKLGLGSYEDVKGSSEIFEEVLESYLKRYKISFIDEKEQVKQFRQRCKEIKEANDENESNEEKEGSKHTTFKTPPTPDCLLCETIQIQKHIRQQHHHRNHQRKKNKSKTNNTSITFDINWVDAKMFYGASSIQPGTKNAVGSLLATAKKYVAHYGQGAFVFFNGYGEELEKMLLSNGVVALDAAPLDLTSVFDHQRTWCANKNGDILP